MIRTDGPQQTPSASAWALVLSTRSSSPGMTRRNRFRPGSMEIFPRSSARFVADCLSDPGDRFVGLGDEVLADTRRAVQASRNEHGYARERGREYHRLTVRLVIQQHLPWPGSRCGDRLPSHFRHLYDPASDPTRA
jgi:hypothetical protein